MCNEVSNEFENVLIHTEPSYICVLLLLTSDDETKVRECQCAVLQKTRKRIVKIFSICSNLLLSPTLAANHISKWIL